MAQLVLHVGAHKTGTTYLQNLFHQNRAALADAGIYYPDIGPNTAHHVLASPWLNMQDVPASFFNTRGPDELWADLIARYATAPGTVFLSGENFLRAYPETVNMAELADRLETVDLGKGCLRFKKLADLPLDTVAEILERAAEEPGFRHG